MSLTTERLKVLDRLIKKISAEPDPASLFSLSLSGLDEALEGVGSASIHLLDQDEDQVMMVELLRLSEDATARLALLDGSGLLPGSGAEPDQPYALAGIGGLEAQLWVVPIRSASLLIGYILLDLESDPEPDQIQFLSTVGHLLGLTIEQAGLISQMSRDLAEIDRIRSELSAKNKELRRQVIRAEEASRLKSQFLANVSHEIRTPMNGILGMTELALKSPLDPKPAQYLKVVQSSADNLLVLINDLLDLSRIDVGKMELEQIPFNLRTTVEGIFDALALKAEEKRLDLIHQIRPGTPVYITGDPGRLRQVLINLLANAVKFTDRGEVRLVIEAEDRTEERATLLFTVTDTGPGIPPADQEKIFLPFIQADGTATRVHGGTGLGLAIAAELVNLMGGEIDLVSEPGQGSSFSFSLEFELHPEGREEATPGYNLTGLGAMVIDDNATNRLVLKEMLATWGAELSEADSAAGTLARLTELKKASRVPALILLDGQLGDGNGFDLAEEIYREKLAPGASIIMLTSIGHPGDARRCLDLGVGCYLIKPVKMSDLRQAINEVMGRRAKGGQELITRHTLAERFREVRVLLAEDNRVNRMVIEEMLGRLGWKVIPAATGREAVRMAVEEPFDVVLMDLQMPDLDGLQAARLIREEPDLAGLPIIALTAHAMAGHREECLAAGMNDYLSKPVKSGILIETITRHLNPAREETSKPEEARPSDPDESRRAGTEAQLQTSFGERGGELPPLDLNEALALVDNDRKLLLTVVRAFMEETAGLVAELQTALAGGEWVAAEEAAHRIKGSADQLAALELKALAVRIGQLLAEDRTREAIQVSKELELGLLKVGRYLDRVVALSD